MPLNIGILEKLTGIRSGELTRTLLMGAYSFTIIASYNTLKPMTRSLFVTHLGPDRLPWLYILLTVVIGVFMVFYLKLSARLKLHQLINFTNLILLSNLLIFWWLLGNLESPGLYYALFIWVSIYGVMTTSQFWLLASDLFIAREAKRLFPFLTTCAISGGIAGGYFTSFFVREIGSTTDLTLFCFALVVISSALVHSIFRVSATPFPVSQPTHSEQSQETFVHILSEFLGFVRDSRHLALLMGIVAITFMVVQIADFQFVAYGNEASEGTDDLTSFLGVWLSNMSIIALLFQVVFSGTIIKRFGVGVTILVLPAALLVGSVGVFFSYGLISIIVLKISDGAFRHSINKVGSELLYLPIPGHVKRRTKAFVDMFVDRFGRGLAGVLLLVSYSWLGLSVQQISLVSIALIVIWMVLALATYREYVNSFRQALSKRQIDAELVSVSIKDEATIKALLASLESTNERQVVYALQLLESVEGVDLVPVLVPLLKHTSAEVRLLTLTLANQRGHSDLLADVKLLLADADIEVRREAVRFYAEFSKEPAEEMLGEWLQKGDSGLRGATLFYIAENASELPGLLNPEIIQAFLDRDKEGRLQVADALGVLKDDTYAQYLEDLLNDTECDVRTSAIHSAGKTRNPRFVHQLVESLESKAVRKAAREALTKYGNEIIDLLAECLNDLRYAREVRQLLPRILGAIRSQRSVEILLANLNQTDENIRFQVIKALNKLRAKSPELAFDQRVDSALITELKNYFRILAALHITKSGNGAYGFDLLRKVLQERLDDYIDRIFRLLGLKYPPRDIYNAYAGTTSGDKTIRSNAVEFLDNILSNDLKRWLLPILDDVPEKQILQQADGELHVDFKGLNEALRSLATHADSWLRACAIYEIGESGLVEDFRDELERALGETNPIVQETASLVLSRN